MEENIVFEGFRKPESHFFLVPNEWTDITADIDNLAELKVIEYVMRHTWGFQEYDRFKHITVDEFRYGRMKADGTRMDHGTKLSEMSVRNGLEKAIKHGYLLCETDDSDKARIKKSYKLKMMESEVQELGTEVQTLDLQTQMLDLGTKKVRPRSEKETKETNRGKERRKESVSSHVTEENSTTDSPDVSFHSSIQSSNLSSKPRKMGFIKAPVREVLEAIKDEQPEQYHFDRAHDLWLKCDVEDIKAFRDKIYTAKVQATGRDMEYFYHCLERAVKSKV